MSGESLVRRYFEQVFNEPRTDACDELVAARYVEHAIAPFGTTEPGEVDGPSHTRSVVEWLRAQFPDLRMTVEAIVADAGMVAVRVLSEHWAVRDDLTTMVQLGVIARPGRSPG